MIGSGRASSIGTVNQQEVAVSTQPQANNASTTSVQAFDTIVIGGGQAGLSVGYFLARHGRPFVILDAGERIGDAWRARWDSMRLFTPARRDGLPGMPFRAPKHSFPSRDEMADYLEEYASCKCTRAATAIRAYWETIAGDDHDRD